MSPAAEDLSASGEIEDCDDGGEGNQREEVRGDLRGRELGVERIALGRPLFQFVLEVATDASHEGNGDAGDGSPALGFELAQRLSRRGVDRFLVPQLSAHAGRIPQPSHRSTSSELTHI